MLYRPARLRLGRRLALCAATGWLKPAPTCRRGTLKTLSAIQTADHSWTALISADYRLNRRWFPSFAPLRAACLEIDWQDYFRLGAAFSNLPYSPQQNWQSSAVMPLAACCWWWTASSAYHLRGSAIFPCSSAISAAAVLLGIRRSAGKRWPVRCG